MLLSYILISLRHEDPNMSKLIESHNKTNSWPNNLIEALLDAEFILQFSEQFYDFL